MPMQRRTLALAAVALCSGALAHAAEPPPPGDATAVADAVEALRRAMVDVDRPALEALLADQLSYGHSDGRVMNKAEFIASLVEKRSVFHAITLSDPTLSMSGDTAVVRHRFTADAVSSGKAITPRIAILQVWQRQGGPWRMLARQGFNT